MKKIIEKKDALIPAEFIKKVWEESWTYIRTVVDIMHEPILILDKELRVMAANDCFYQRFMVEPKDTEGKIVYDLGNGQWDIPALRKLLEDILPKHIHFKGFEVEHNFPNIGHKVMILNARQIYFTEDASTKIFPPTIILAMEDVTDMMAVAESLADRTRQFETKVTERTTRLESQIHELTKALAALTKKP